MRQQSEEGERAVNREGFSVVYVDNTRKKSLIHLNF